MRWIAFLLMLCLSAAASAQTTCGKVSACPTASLPLSGAELLYIVQNGQSRRIPASSFIQNIPLNPTFTDLTVTGSFTATGLVTNADLAHSSLTLGSTALTLGTTTTTVSGLMLASPTVTGAFTATGLVTNADLAGSIAASKLVGTDIATVGILTTGAINWTSTIQSSDSKTGPITADGADVAVYSNKANLITANSIWACMNFAACNPGAAPGIYDGIRSVVTVNTGSTINDVGAISAYGVNNNAGGGTGAPLVGFIGEVISAVNGSSSWGMNLLCSDRLAGLAQDNTLTGRGCLNEIDYQINSSHTQAIGLFFGGNSQSQPTGDGYAIGLALERLDGFPGTGNVAKWTNFLSSASGSTAIFAEIGEVQAGGACFTGVITGNTTLTVTGIVGSGIIGFGATLNGTSVTGGTTIVSGPTAGGNGTYTITSSANVSSETMCTSSASQSVIYNAFNQFGNTIQAVQQLDGAGDFILNAPSGGTVLLGAAGNYALGVTALGAAISGGVTSPTLSPGVLFLTGNGASMAANANGEAALFANSAGGVVLIGQGSATDFLLENKAGTTVCTVGTGATTLNCANFTVSSSSGNITAGTMTMSGLSANVGTKYLCINDGTGVVSFQSTCTVSAIRFKEPIGIVDGRTALDGVSALRPASWTYQLGRGTSGVHVGLYADDVAKMDPHCAVYDDAGDVESYDDKCVIAYLVAAVQEMRREHVR